MPLVSYVARKGPTQKRVVTLTVSGSTYTPDAATTDIAAIVNPAAAFTIANPTGTPLDGQMILFRIKATAARAITWGSGYVSSGLATLPSTTIANKTILVLTQYDSTASKWVCTSADGTGY